MINLFTFLANLKKLEQFDIVEHEIVKLASNENPGCITESLENGMDALKRVHLYPDGRGTFLLEVLLPSFPFY